MDFQCVRYCDSQKLNHAAMLVKLCSFVYRSYGLSMLLRRISDFVEHRKLQVRHSPAKSKAVFDALEQLHLEDFLLRLHNVDRAVAKLVGERVVDL